MVIYGDFPRNVSQRASFCRIFSEDASIGYIQEKEEII